MCIVTISDIQSVEILKNQIILCCTNFVLFQLRDHLMLNKHSIIIFSCNLFKLFLLKIIKYMKKRITIFSTSKHILLRFVKLVWCT